MTGHFCIKVGSKFYNNIANEKETILQVQNLWNSLRIFENLCYQSRNSFIMAMMNNPLLDFKRNRQFQGLVDVLAECLPDNANLQEKLSDLTSSKGSYIKQLVAKWDQRMQPDYTELDIRQLNIQYLARQDLAQVNLEVRDENISTISSKDWILKERDIWRGYNPESGNYFQKPIGFGSKLDWDVHFCPW